MTQLDRENEFSILGCKVKVRPDTEDGALAASVVQLVNLEVNQLKSSRPTLKDTDVAILVALKMATEKLKLESEYKANVEKLESTLFDAIQLLEAQ
jgi:cell division protein ZapA (FtsZ GTPase activity inhibitor)